tara:strand:+ start:442 stop:1353 length:912 start_codon:yes stop_codon:yes gene_type:complete
MNDLNALVIGAGMIGRHHISSLISSGFEVDVVDPINPKIIDSDWHKKLNDILVTKNKIFIISTTAKDHFDIVKRIVVSKKNKVIIVEKPLFCNKSDYLKFDRDLSKLSHRIFCNLPFFYNEKLKELKYLGNMKKYSAYGVNWGLACNILHDISIIDAITNEDDLKILNIVTEILNLKESKRAGYYEVYGKVNFLLNNIEVDLSCNLGNSYQKIVDIQFDKGSVRIDFSAEKIQIKSLLEETKNEAFAIPRASETTGKIAKLLLSGAEVLPRVDRYTDISMKVYSSIVAESSIPDTNSLDFPFS